MAVLTPVSADAVSAVPSERLRYEELTGWGRTPRSTSRVIQIDSRRGEDLRGHDLARGALTRGMGRAYGDAALNAGGLVLRLDPEGPIELEETTGVLRAGGGVSFDRIMAEILPRGWFVPVTAGTRAITVGGALACDVHGKNHHVDGSFAHHVVSFELMDVNGEIRTITRESDPVAWAATIGGMGLTGPITAVTFALIPVDTTFMTVDTDRARDLDDLMAAMAEGDDRYRYSVAWIDLLATGSRLGRGVLTRGDHARGDQIDASRDTRGFTPRRLLDVPDHLPRLIGRRRVAAFNEFWFRSAPRSQRDDIQPLSRFFHPLDAVGWWNRLYGPEGFLQYQLLIPFTAETTLVHLVETVARSGAAGMLAVLKRFGEGSGAPLSFPEPGWTLTIDLPARDDSVRTLLRELDEMVLGVGGRHYLAKDAHLSPDSVRRGYPHLGEWRDLRDQVDPQRHWTSDLARRLRLMDPDGSSTQEVSDA